MQGTRTDIASVRLCKFLGSNLTKVAKVLILVIPFEFLILFLGNNTCFLKSTRIQLYDST